jgi:DeoR family fructose operon transcriptional repressor
MLAEQRRLRIAELLSQNPLGIISVEEFSHTLNVSEMTIRRDLNFLEESGLIKRVHGGAVLLQDNSPEKAFSERHDEFSTEKELIGAEAAHLVQNHESVILDAGTTTLQIARNLNCYDDLTVITNALPIAFELNRCQGVQTILLGGMLKRRELCSVGPTTTQQLSRLSVDQLFLSSSGFSIEAGITDPDFREVEVKEAMIRAAREVILVADSSKWNVRSLVRITSIQSVHRIITDSHLPERALASLKMEGIEVIIALPQKTRDEERLDPVPV